MFSRAVNPFLFAGLLQEAASVWSKESGQSHFLIGFPACTWISTEDLFKTTATAKPKHVYSGVTLWLLEPSFKILVMEVIENNIDCVCLLELLVLVASFFPL